MNVNRFDQISYISSKKNYIFREIELAIPKIKKIQEGTFRAQKIKNPTLKKSLTFWEIEHSSLKLKKLLYCF